MNLRIFTEEESIKVVLENILPKLVPDDVIVRIHPHQGKEDLENALRKTLNKISRIPNTKVLILRDQDSHDCKEVKSRLKAIVEQNCHCDYFIRVVCRELESWFLGDLFALKQAYVRFNPSLIASKQKFRNVDLIQRPSEELLKIIPDLKTLSYLPKLKVSSEVSKYLRLDNNKSHSFNHTINAIKRLTSD